MSSGLITELIESPDIDSWSVLADWYADRNNATAEKLWRKRHQYGKVLLPVWKMLIDNPKCIGRGDFISRFVSNVDLLVSSQRCYVMTLVCRKYWKGTYFNFRVHRACGYQADNHWPAQRYLRDRLFTLVYKIMIELEGNSNDRS